MTRRRQRVLWSLTPPLFTLASSTPKTFRVLCMTIGGMVSVTLSRNGYSNI